MKKALVMSLALCLAFAGVAFADVTGDFKVLNATYTNSGDLYGGDVDVWGTVNNGAIVSGKTVVVNVNYEYSFQYRIGEDTTTTKTVYCPNEHSNDDACKDQRKKDTDVVRVITTTTTVVKTYDANGMVAVTEPTLDSRGRLNPKGKITGWDWVSTVSILPSNITVDLALIPDGAALVLDSIEIKKVSYTAYLKDKLGFPIADTVASGVLFQ
jgi:hypothetical protein